MIIIINQESQDSKSKTKRMVMAQSKVVCGFTYCLRRRWWDRMVWMRERNVFEIWRIEEWNSHAIL